jgi:hypothetical protein
VYGTIRRVNETVRTCAKQTGINPSAFARTRVLIFEISCYKKIIVGKRCFSWCQNCFLTNIYYANRGTPPVWEKILAQGKKLIEEKKSEIAMEGVKGMLLKPDSRKQAPKSSQRIAYLSVVLFVAGGGEQGVPQQDLSNGERGRDNAKFAIKV